MLTIQSQASTLDLVGGELCLDFVNTVGGWRDHGNEHDHLEGFSDLLAWSVLAGTTSVQTAEILEGEAARRRTEADTTLTRAIRLREAIYRVAAAIAEGRAVTPVALESLNTELGDQLSHSKLIATTNGFGLAWAGPEGAFEQLLWPIARSSIDLFTSQRLARVRQCGGSSCGWLFVDSSRNGRRRWCDMRDCGNRAKARRHIERLRERAASDATG